MEVLPDISVLAMPLPANVQQLNPTIISKGFQQSFFFTVGLVNEQISSNSDCLSAVARPTAF